jgi:hypothetical protein
MMHFGAAGVFGGPRQAEREPDADRFREGEVWETSRGTLYRVVVVGPSGEATLRLGATGGRGRIVRKPCDDVGNWRRVSQLV